MPFIHIKSLPLGDHVDVSAVLAGVTRDFVRATGIDGAHVTCTWELLAPGHYAVAGKSAVRQPRDSHPVLVDLLAPDVHSAGAVETMLATVAASIAEHAGLSAENVFVNYRPAHSGAVLDAGEIVRW